MFTDRKHSAMSVAAAEVAETSSSQTTIRRQYIYQLSEMKPHHDTDS